MRTKLLSVVVFALCIAMIGCQVSPVQKGGLIGGAVGAATGGIWAANAGTLTALEGAAIGAAVGTGGGSLAGDAWARRKKGEGEEETEAEPEAMPAPVPQVDTRQHDRQINGLKNDNSLKSRRIEELEDQLDGLRDQLKRRPMPDQVSMAPPAPAAPTLPASAMAAVSEEEVRDLQRALGGDVEVGMSDKGITVTFVSEVLFTPGRASLTKNGISAIGRTAKALRERYPNNEINVEGHTDNVPVKQSGYRSNWELSADRAAMVVHHLIDQEGFRPDLLSITGYGDTRPVAPNETSLGRRLNRRAVLVILPDMKYQKEQLSY